MLIRFGHISQHSGWAEQLWEKGLCLTGLELSQILKIECFQPSAVLGDLGDPGHISQHSGDAEQL